MRDREVPGSLGVRAALGRVHELRRDARPAQLRHDADEPDEVCVGLQLVSEIEADGVVVDPGDLREDAAPAVEVAPDAGLSPLHI